MLTLNVTFEDKIFIKKLWKCKIFSASRLIKEIYNKLEKMNVE